MVDVTPRRERLAISLILVSLALGSCMRPPDASAQDGGRDAWQRVPDVIAALSIGPGDRVADVGAGTGYFTVHLSTAVGPEGRVFAVEISENALSRLQRLVASQAHANIEVIRGEVDDPLLSSNSLDAALLVDSYHEMTEHEAMLRRLYEALGPGGRLVVLDLATGDDTALRGRQMAAHGLGIDLVARELLAAGFELLDRQPRFTRTGRGRTQWMLVARRPGHPRGTARH